MLDSGGGDGYTGVTNWYLHDVPTMWTMLRDQQTDNHWTHVSGWRKTSELTSTHLWRLEEYRDKLAEAWPPEKNPAAAAYLSRLNYLIESVRQTHDVAAANYTTLAGATAAIGTGRIELKKVYDEYVAKQQEKKDYEDRVAFDAASQLPGTTQGDPPVTDADLERLNDKARGIMYALSSELSQAQAEIKQPPPYTPVGAKDPGDPDVYGESAPPPVIPPIVPVPAAGRSAPATTSASGTQVVPAPVAPGAGPVLGGAGPLAPPAPVNPVSPGVITPAPPPASGPGGGILPGLPAGPGMLRGSGGIRGASPIAAPVNPATGSVIKPGAGGAAGAPRAMPVGGLIGGAPGAGLGQPGAGAASARRINPIGGVIGGAGAGTTPMGGAGQRSGAGAGRSPLGSAGQPFGTAQSDRAGLRRDDDSGHRWDPDNPWETDEGVAPVVLPPREAGRIDPGPAIGFHR